MKKSKGLGIALAILAAALYAVNSPFSKLLLDHMPPTLMAGFLYIGAGAGMGVIAVIRKLNKKEPVEETITRADLPYTLAMIVLDIAAPIFLLLGLSKTTAANASLLNNFEIVATALIALVIFKEKISKRLWAGIGFVVLSCALLSFEDISSLRFSVGSLFVLLACVCWGIENNCTRRLSEKDPLYIVLLKGIFSGLGSVIIGLAAGERITALWSVFAVLAVGCVAYGLSIFFYVYAQRHLGAARTSAYYAVAPFIGMLLSLAVFLEIPTYIFYIALAFMAIGAWLCSSDEPLFKKRSIPRGQRKIKTVIETKRLILREYTHKDFKALYAILSDPETMKYYPKPYDKSGTMRWLDWSLDNYQKYGFGLWAIELKENGEFIGDCGITIQNIDGELLPEIGYHIRKDHWRKGYAKEACAAVKEWFFKNTDYDSVYSYMNSENVASCATAASNGMTKIKEYTDGEENLCVYTITRKEWETVKD